MKNESIPHKDFWKVAAKRVRRRINFGFWLQKFLPGLAVVAVVTGGALILARRQEWATGPVWIGLLVLLLPLGAWALYAAKRRFYGVEDSFAWLDARLRLHNALTAARAGVGSWPPPASLPPLMNWTWRRVAVFPLFAIGFVLLSAWIPVQRAAPPETATLEEPSSWQQVETWIDVLKESDVVEEKNLHEWQEQVEALRNQETNDWYSHSSLEAGDTLERNAEHSILELEQALEKATYPLTAARDAIDQPGNNLDARLQEHWLEALSNLEEQSLRLSEDLMADLREVDLSNIQALDQEQIERLREKMRKGREACGVCLGGGEGENGRGTAPGAGGIARGPGSAPLGFDEFPSMHQADRREAVASSDFSRAALGETLGVTESEPDSEPAAYTGPEAGGEIASPGEGGEAVWRSRLTPAEQEQLRRYFD